MPKQDSDESRSVAVYWDFENLHASRYRRRSRRPAAH